MPRPLWSRLCCLREMPEVVRTLAEKLGDPVPSTGLTPPMLKKKVFQLWIKETEVWTTTPVVRMYEREMRKRSKDTAGLRKRP